MTTPSKWPNALRGKLKGLSGKRGRKKKGILCRFEKEAGETEKYEPKQRAVREGVKEAPAETEER